MYEGVVTNVRTYGGLTDEFSITIGVHQESSLCSFLFVIVMDEITKNLHEKNVRSLRLVLKELFEGF